MDNISLSIFNKLRHWIDNAIDINAPDDKGHFLIQSIINSDNPSLLIDAIKKGINVNQDIGNGWTALHEAIDLAIDGMIQNDKQTAYPEPIEMIKILLDNGADLQRKDKIGKTPLDSLNIYSANIDTFNHLKGIFRVIISDIDGRIQYNAKAS